MNSPLVSVVIPAYNQAEFLGEAIQSVLNQTYDQFEIVVVNDASPDQTNEVVAQYNDPRIKNIIHEKNQGLPASRNTGIKVAKGDVIALLDSDDIFHPDKLKTHVAFLQTHPEIGATYNPRFNLNHSSFTIRDLWTPPSTIDLSDLVLGFPFSPSDMVFRREWAFRVGMFDEQYVSGGEDLDFPCRLALAGCKFASVERALNYRRYHSFRNKKNLQSRLNDYLSALNKTFDNPNCPRQILALKNTSISNFHLEVVFLAFIQCETDFGQENLHKAIQLRPSLLDGDPCELIKFFLTSSIKDESRSHEIMIKKIMAQLPSDLNWLLKYCDWIIAQGYLHRGVRAIIWERTEDGYAHFERASELKAKIDKSFLRSVSAQLLDYEAEFGYEAANTILKDLSVCLQRIGDPLNVRWLRGSFSINHAFKNYHQRNFMQARTSALQAIYLNPTFLFNRGVLAVFFSSIGNEIMKRNALTAK